MNAASRDEAQRRADDIRVFREELSRLGVEGVLSLNDEQRGALASHHDALLAGLARGYDIDRDSRSKQLSLGMRIVSFMGAIAIAASVFFLFYQFWGYVSTLGQVSILVVVPIVAFVATMLVAHRDPTDYFSKLAALVAFTCFVLNIAMLGQILNITPSDKALLPWAAFAFLLAYSFDLRLLQAAGILCLIAFISARVGTWSGMYWIHFGERPENFFPAALALFFVPQVFGHERFPGFPPMYRIFGLLALFVPMLVLANWGSASYLDLSRHLVENLYQTLGFLGTALSIWYGTRRDWPEVVNTGVTLFVIFFFSKLFDWWWDVMPKSLFFFLMGLAAILLLLVFKRLRGARP
jgi:uncharacterized membrane protein